MVDAPNAAVVRRDTNCSKWPAFLWCVMLLPKVTNIELQFALSVPLYTHCSCVVAPVLAMLWVLSRRLRIPHVQLENRTMELCHGCALNVHCR